MRLLRRLVDCYDLLGLVMVTLGTSLIVAAFVTWPG